MRIIVLLAIIASLKTAAQEPRMMLPVGHPQGILQASYSADDKMVVSRSFNDINARVWDAKTGHLLHNFPMQETVSEAKFSPDNRSLVTVSYNQGKVWDLHSGEESARFSTEPNDEFFQLGFFNRSDRFYTAGKKSVQVWDTKGNLVFSRKFEATVELLDHRDDSSLLIVTKDVHGISKFFSLNYFTGDATNIIRIGIFRPFVSGTHICIVFKDETTALYDKSTLVRKKYFTIDPGDILAFSVSPMADLLFVSFADSTVVVYNTASSETLWSLELDSRTIANGEFIGKGDSLILYDQYSWSWIVDARTGKDLYDFDQKPLSHLDRTVGSFISLNSSREKALMVYPDNVLRSWSLRDSIQLEQTFSGKTIGITARAVSPVTPHFATGNQAGEITVFNTSSGKVDMQIPGTGVEVSALLFDNESRYLVSAADTFCKVWEFPSGKLLATLPHSNMITFLDISEDGKQILTSMGNFTFGALSLKDTVVRLWDWKKGKVLKAIKNQKHFIYFKASFGVDDKTWICLNPADSTVQILDAKTLRPLWLYKAEHWLFEAVQTADEKEILLLNQTAVDVVDIASKRRIKRFSISNDTGEGGYALSRDQNMLITGEKAGVIKLWNYRSGKLIDSIKGHTSGVIPSFIRHDSSMITTSADGTVKVWDAPGFRYRYQLIPMQNELFIQTASQHYISSPGAAKLLHYVTPGMKTITFEQLDVKYNRPDLVLKTIGSTDTSLLLSYKKAYEKRIRKLGVDTTAFGKGIGLPEADISNREEISFEQHNSTLKIRVQGKDPAYPLERFNVWVNESPLFGMKGISLRTRYTNVFDTTFSIELAAGNNQIETSVTNSQGTESYRLPLRVKYVPSVAVQEKLYFIGIGINSFYQPGHGLSWSVKDIRDLADSLSKKYGNHIIVDTLFNRDVTIENITRLKSKLTSSSVNDKVIVSYSGHGLLSSDFDYYLSTYHVNFDKPEENGLPYELLENLLDGIPARKKLMLIDACHSGEVDKEEMEKYVLVEKTLGDSGTKSSRKPVPKDGKVGMQNSFELMQQLFVNVGRSTGATVISAAAGTQFAQEQADLQNGVFTYSILEYMKSHPTATVSELRAYVNKRVTELTNGMQVPTTRSETKAVDWRVW